ncbi:DUF6950 family protein [Maritalea sp.]|jgi:hypothetical protein|uniref:DUF6950 family protein n=1 Tax=Maritalea sp. TaxID=2003361 RepID=UPI0039E68A36
MAAAVRAKHGDDHPILDYLSRYNDKRSALRLIKNEGGIANVLSRFFVETTPLMAQDGDIGVVERGGIEAGCVVMNGSAVGLDLSGYYHLPITALSRVFRV